MKNIFTLLFCLLTSIGFSQKNFEGILKFKFSLEDKTGEMSKEETKEFIGDEQTYYLKGKKYKAEMNGMLKMTMFYEGKDTIFTKMNGVDALMYMLTNEDEEKVISYDFKKTDKVVLDYKCELLEVKTNKGFYQYYFNKTLKVDPSTYKNHKSGLWDFFTEKTDGALSIIVISDTKEEKTYLELISVERKELDGRIFIKPNLPVIKMPEE